MSLDHTFAWIRSHRPLLMDLVRIYLGIGLFFKGIFFLVHPEALASLATGSMASVAGFVPYIHIIGGLMIAAGVFTRLGAIIQIPVVAAAVFAVNLPRMRGMETREAVEFSALTLFLLVLIAIWGAGPLALDRKFGLKRQEAPHQAWLDAHPDLFMDLIRAYLGVALFIKGVYILENQAEFQLMVENVGSMPLGILAAAHYVIPAHFVGGAMLLIGFATRWAAAAQLPLLFGALFYVYMPRFASLELRQNIEFTALVLFLLCVITVYGAGRYSIDYLMQRSAAEDELHRVEAIRAGAKARA